MTYYPELGGAGYPASGFTYYFRTGGTGWNFPGLETADGGAIGSKYDSAGSNVGNWIDWEITGPVTVTVHTRPPGHAAKFKIREMDDNVSRNAATEIAVIGSALDCGTDFSWTVPAGTHWYRLDEDVSALGFGYDGITVSDPIVPKVTFTVGAVEFTNLLEKRIRVELNGCGSGSFVISRGDAQATEANLARGNVVKVTIPEIDPDPIFEFIIEEGDYDLISNDEEGGEELRFGGPGTLAILRRAVVHYTALTYPEGPKLDKGYWEYADVAPGDVVRRFVLEAQARDVLDMVTLTFNASIDSDGVAWANTTQWISPIGENLYDEVMRLVAAGQLHIEMSPGFELNAYQSMGVDRTSTTFGTGKVRFVKGVNIADELVRGMPGYSYASHAIVHGSDNSWSETNLASYPYKAEIAVEVNSSKAATKTSAGQRALGAREEAQESLIFAHIVPWPGDGPDEANGIYLPGQAWTDNGKYWVGDLVTLHTGAGEFDFENATQQVYAITLYEDVTGYLAPPIVELNAPFASTGSANLSPIGAAGGGTSSGGSSGTGIHTHPQYASRLDDLSDVDAPTPADQDVLTWDDYLQAWVPQAGGGSAADAELNIEGGQSVISVHGNTGATETIDPTAGNVHTLTLDADCTLTLDNPVGSGACTLLLWVTQDGTGGRDITWPGTVTVIGTHDTTASTTARCVLETIDGGTSWVATWVGGGSAAPLEVTDGTLTVNDVTEVEIVYDGAGGIALDDLTDVDATTPSDGDVIVWDDYLQTWVAQAPTGGASALDDLADVNAPAPSDNDVLTWDSGTSMWIAQAPSGGSVAVSDLTDVDLTGLGDGDILQYDSGTGDWLPIGMPSGTVPDGTADGDLLVWDDYLQSWEALARGAEGEVLTAGAASIGWEAASGGSTVYAFPLDVPPASAHAKDDEFEGASLDGKWTDPTTSAAGQTNTITVANGFMTIEPATTGTGNTGKHVFGIRQAAPAGSFTISARLAEGGPGNDVRAGIFVGINGAKGHVCGPFLQDNAAGFIGVTTVSNTADWSGYDGTLTTIASPSAHVPTWAKIKWDAGTSTLTFYVSHNGHFWRTVGSRGSMSQPDQIGIAIYSNSGAILAHETIGAGWFRVTEP